jgi:pimeloyl-ACP methyl ester carboxylesterase
MTKATAKTALIDIDGAIEYRLEPGVKGASGLAPLVFLHEGLGSVALWRDFPDRVRGATGGRAMLVYSRHGYGQSAPIPSARTARYMHDEALVVLPCLLDELGLARPVLIGHSDGGSIALIYAGSGHPVAGLALLAPHVFVEDRTIAGIEAARTAYRETDLAARMARYHRDADLTFRGWNDIWLSAEFRHWNIEDYLGGIDGSVLLVQGDADDYGSLAQLDAIEAGVNGPVERVVFAGGGHAPHLDHPDETVAAISRFVTTLR